MTNPHSLGVPDGRHTATEFHALRRRSPDPKGVRLHQKIVDCGGMEDFVEVMRVDTRVAYLKEDGSLIPGAWWVRFEGSQERMLAGNARPDFNVGDLVTILVVKKR